MAPQRDLADRGRHECGEEQSHLDLEHRILQRSRWLADDHDDARQEQDDERPPDERQEARQDLLQRLVRGVEAKKAEIDHQRGGRDHRDAEE